MESNNQSSGSVDELDRQINEARKRQQSKGQGPAVQATRRRLTPEEVAAKKLKHAAELAEKRVAREAARAAKRAEREASRTPAHMAKVLKAGAKLPVLNEDLTAVFDSMVNENSLEDIESLAAHFDHFVRARRTEMSLSAKLTVGSFVRIVGGGSRLVGRVGRVSKVQRIRAMVDIEGEQRPAYVFIADCRVVREEGQPLSVEETSELAQVG